MLINRSFIWSFIEIETFKQCKKSIVQKQFSQGSRDVLRNFAKFTGKHLCQGLFFNKVAGLPKKVFFEISQNSQENTCARMRSATLFKKTLAQVFSCEFCELSKNVFFKEHLRTTVSDCFNVGCFFGCLLWPT